jgi:hypothetical protein
MSLSELSWRKSTRSASGECLEVAFAENSALVRDSKDQEGPVLRFTLSEWGAFLAGVRSSEFDMP